MFAIPTICVRATLQYSNCHLDDGDRWTVRPVVYNIEGADTGLCRCGLCRYCLRFVLIGCDRETWIEISCMREMKTLHINGVDQRYCVLGTNPDNPVLIYVHGGPGDTCLPLIEKYNSALSEHFNVVVWEQRGAGFSYYPFTESNHPTVNTYIEDLQVLTRHVLDTYHQEKVYLIGHSWGSVLGIRFIQEHPELVRHYIGCGRQVVNFDDITKEQIAFVRAHTSDKRTLAFLDSYQKDSQGADWMKALLRLTKLVVKYGGSIYGRSNMNNLIRPFITLITLGKPPLAKNKSLIKSILLVGAEGRKAAVGEIADYGHADTVQPPAGYVQPRHEKQYQKRTAWFAVKNLYEVDCRDGQVIGYKTTEGQAVPDCFTGQVTMRYVCHA